MNETEMFVALIQETLNQRDFTTSEFSARGLDVMVFGNSRMPTFVQYQINIFTQLTISET